jgi:hypothetical protein
MTLQALKSVHYRISDSPPRPRRTGSAGGIGVRGSLT